ncbi:MAG: DUF885 domain-containing protein [Microscillaceae bacterium]|jgi:uncharacterized protein (DUF885 family)|nr:DUF885 domain-containing protein [Microscillaceae bacterium]
MLKNLMILLILGLLSFQTEKPFSESAFEVLVKQFAQTYPQIGIVNFEFDYRNNFKNIPSLAKLAQQKNDLLSYQNRLQSIDYQRLKRKNKIQYAHLEYELKFHLRRIDLEEKFRRAGLESAPEGGLSRLPDARDWFRYYAQRYTSLDLSPEELEQYGYAEIARCQTEIKKIQQELGFAQDSLGFYQHINQAQFYYTQLDSIFLAYQRIDNQVRKHLPKLFEVTDIPPVGVQTWQGAGPQTPPGYYNPAEEDSGEKPTFYFNFSSQKHNKRVIDWLYIHEAIPGHHYQFSLRQRQLNESPLMPMFLYAGNFEGWGAYVEYLGADLGLYQNPYTRLGKWEWDLVRSLRVVLDVGIHYRGWDKAQALAFWRQNIANQDDIAEREVNRCFNWTGQVLSYKIGAWKIEQFLQKRRQNQGKKFDIRQFHADFLGFGQMPLAVIERFIND